uniref:Uncharacterized protein n=1 Tax=Amphimedon queenslandica TaxID=400682 RepID=A0A1X7VTP5_AMPQE
MLYKLSNIIVIKVRFPMSLIVDKLSFIVKFNPALLIKQYRLHPDGKGLGVFLCSSRLALTVVTMVTTIEPEPYLEVRWRIPLCKSFIFWSKLYSVYTKALHFSEHQKYLNSAVTSTIKKGEVACYKETSFVFMGAGLVPKGLVLYLIHCETPQLLGLILF